MCCEFLQEFASKNPEAQLIFDLERDRYLVMHIGWRNDDYRIYGCSIHLDIIDNKVWLQNNSTEIFVERELIKRGVSRQDIVFGFRAPSIRERIASTLLE